VSFRSDLKHYIIVTFDSNPWVKHFVSRAYPQESENMATPDHHRSKAVLAVKFNMPKSATQVGRFSISILPQRDPCGNQKLGTFSDMCRGEGLWQVAERRSRRLGTGQTDLLMRLWAV
jgi:hypothetical protein